jgi:hypothetical protein
MPEQRWEEMAGLRGYLGRLRGAEGWRLWLAIPAAAVAANLAPTAFLYLVALAESLPRVAPQIPPIAAMMMAWLATLFLFPIALGQTLVMGVPLHMLLVALRLSAPWIYAVAGVLGGGLAFGALDALLLGELSLTQMFGSAAGLAAALVFRAIWRPLPGSG